MSIPTPCGSARNSLPSEAQLRGTRSKPDRPRRESPVAERLDHTDNLDIGSGIRPATETDSRPDWVLIAKIPLGEALVDNIYRKGSATENAVKNLILFGDVLIERIGIKIRAAPLPTKCPLQFNRTSRSGSFTGNCRNNA